MDSIDVANKYRDMHGLSGDQIAGIDCSSVEILPTENDFNDEVLLPILNILSTTPVSNYNIYAIILGHMIPGGFIDDDGNKISSTSRISRIHYPHEYNLENYLFNRSDFSLYTDSYRDFALICTRIDGSISVVNKLLDNTSVYLRSRVANGTIYMDPYSYDANDSYARSSLYCINNILTDTNLDIYQTYYIDEYRDTVIPFVESDSFVFSRTQADVGQTFFKSSGSNRIFLYNIDDFSSYSVRSMVPGSWVSNAFMANYISAAGHLDEVLDSSIFLNPSAFFKSLMSRATLGESLMFSSRYLNNEISLFGDPLLSIYFPYSREIEDTSIPLSESIQKFYNNLTSSNAYMSLYSILSDNLVDYIVSSYSKEEENALLYVANNNIVEIEQTDNIYAAPYNNIVNLIEINNQYNIGSEKFDNTFININQYLNKNYILVSDIVNRSMIIGGEIEDNNLYETGSWIVEFNLRDERELFSLYHFEIDISRDLDFSDIIYTIRSLDDQGGWSYEYERGKYEELGPEGVSSEYIGRVIRYFSTTDYYLDRYDRFYVRVRQRDQYEMYDSFYNGQGIVFS